MSQSTDLDVVRELGTLFFTAFQVFLEAAVVTDNRR